MLKFNSSKNSRSLSIIFLWKIKEISIYLKFFYNYFLHPISYLLNEISITQNHIIIKKILKKIPLKIILFITPLLKIQSATNSRHSLKLRKRKVEKNEIERNKKEITFWKIHVATIQIDRKGIERGSGHIERTNYMAVLTAVHRFMPSQTVKRLVCISIIREPIDYFNKCNRNQHLVELPGSAVMTSIR